MGLFEDVEAAEVERARRLWREHGDKVMGLKPSRAGDLDKDFKPTGSDPFDDISKFRLTAEDVRLMQRPAKTVIRKMPIEQQLDRLESMVARIAAHLGIEE